MKTLAPLKGADPFTGYDPNEEVRYSKPELQDLEIWCHEIGQEGPLQLEAEILKATYPYSQISKLFDRIIKK